MIPVKEIRARRETETLWDGTKSETRFYHIARKYWEWLYEYGCLAAVALCEPGVISVAACFDDSKWNGHFWLHDELANSGL